MAGLAGWLVLWAGWGAEGARGDSALERPGGEGGERRSRLEEMFRERTRTVVAVEYFVQLETEREPRDAIGVVADENGLVVLIEDSVPGWIPPGQLRDFKAYRPGAGDKGFAVEYLGQDHVSGWHFLRVEEAMRSLLTPVSAFGQGAAGYGEPVWGIGLLEKDYDFEPALLRSYVGLIKGMPQDILFTETDIASPGCPVFNGAGDFVGWGSAGSPEEKLLFTQQGTLNVGLQSPRGTTLFLAAKDFWEYAGRVPEAVTGTPRPWMGVAGMQPVDRDFAEFLDLGDQGAVVISEVVAGSPAAQADLRGRDIVLEIDGQPMPKFRPENILLRYFELQMRTRAVGSEVILTVLREGEAKPREVAVKLVAAPPNLREVERKYFEGPGFSVRDFTLFDAINRRILSLDYAGAVVQFVKPNSPAATAGLRPGDWVQEIDGQAAATYGEALRMLEAAAGELEVEREELVLLVNRNNETQVLRVKLR